MQLGWSVREAHGEGNGRAYLGPFKADIVAMYEKGTADKRFKFSPISMFEVLCDMYPRRYDLPSIVEVCCPTHMNTCAHQFERFFVLFA
jgi:hypothetical protein